MLHSVDKLLQDDPGLPNFVFDIAYAAQSRKPVIFLGLRDLDSQKLTRLVKGAPEIHPGDVVELRELAVRVEVPLEQVHEALASELRLRPLREVLQGPLRRVQYLVGSRSPGQLGSCTLYGGRWRDVIRPSNYRFTLFWREKYSHCITCESVRTV